MKKVITYGTFDLLHEGHYNLLQRAKALGGYLIVGVTTERYDSYRGKLNVVESLMQRIENVKKTGLADEIIIEDHEGQKVGDIDKYRIDIFAIGSDWIGKFDYLKDFCEVVYLERTKGVSSTILRNQSHGIIKLGVVGSGRIAGRFVPESKYVSGINVHGVFNPNIESAQRFCDKHSLGMATDKYNVLLDEVDAVYIATPHHTHFEYAKEALATGKHVLCEKPAVLSGIEASELLATAKSKGVIFLEGIKTAYTPGFLYLLEMAKSSRIGTIYDIEACFTALRPEGRREWEAVNGGSFTELASYPLFGIFKLFGIGYSSICFDSFVNSRGIDVYTKAYLTYGDRIATAKVALGAKSEGQMIITGSNGYIIVESPWWKTEVFEICYENRELNERFFNKFKGEGLRYEISDFVRRIQGNENGGLKILPNEIEAIANVIEKFLKRENVRLIEINNTYD